MTVPDQQRLVAGTPGSTRRRKSTPNPQNDFALKAALQGSLQGEIMPGRPSPVSRVQHSAMQNRALTAE
jgi:hypothetical protein